MQGPPRRPRRGFSRDADLAQSTGLAGEASSGPLSLRNPCTQTSRVRPSRELAKRRHPPSHGRVVPLTTPLVVGVSSPQTDPITTVSSKPLAVKRTRKRLFAVVMGLALAAAVLLWW